MWVEYNPNPVARNVGDCSIRALCKALDIDWETAYSMSAMNGFQMCDMMVSDAVWGSVLRQHGFSKHVVPNYCPDCYTIREFAEDNPNGTYVVGTGEHVVTIVDGNWYDSWDSGNEIPIYYWTYKERGWSKDGIQQDDNTVQTISPDTTPSAPANVGTPTVPTSTTAIN